MSWFKNTNVANKYFKLRLVFGRLQLSVVLPRVHQLVMRFDCLDCWRRSVCLTHLSLCHLTKCGHLFSSNEAHTKDIKQAGKTSFQNYVSTLAD